MEPIVALDMMGIIPIKADLIEEWLSDERAPKETELAYNFSEKKQNEIRGLQKRYLEAMEAIGPNFEDVIKTMEEQLRTNGIGKRKLARLEEGMIGKRSLYFLYRISPDSIDPKRTLPALHNGTKVVLAVPSPDEHVLSPYLLVDHGSHLTVAYWLLWSDGL
jgi:hypothetical protein